MFDRAETLEKYQSALLLANQELFEKGRQHYQDVDLLRKLRNALVHYTPSWEITGAETSEDRFVQKLRGEFDPNPLTGEGTLFFLDKCLGDSCVQWAVKSSIAFNDDFFARMQMKPFFAYVRNELDPEYSSGR